MPSFQWGLQTPVLQSLIAEVPKRLTGSPAERVILGSSPSLRLNMNKLTRLSEIRKIIRPHCATLVGGVFDLFHIGHLRYLRECSDHGRPLVVIVQSDKTTRCRKGFNRPIISQRRRAEIIASLEFVDHVLILDKPSHYSKYLAAIRPKTFVFSKENMRYRKYRKMLIQKEFLRVNVVFIPKRVRGASTSHIIQKIHAQRDYDKIKDKIVKKLYLLADKNPSRIGKISAILTLNGKIVAESSNNDKKETHAETMVIDLARRGKIPLESVKLVVLIPPCIMCANVILKTPIRQIFYLHPYGNDDGVTLLRKHGIHVQKYIPNKTNLKK